jgi:predicted HD phosphohydrolase
MSMPSLADLVGLVLDGRGRHDGGEVVDDLAHAVQCAVIARAACDDRELIGAALLHDVGHHPELAHLHPHHETVAAMVLQPVLGERVSWVVAHHVDAKRHLAAVDSGYYDTLSEASKDSLREQGGPAELEVFTGIWGREALELRRWDEAAKVADATEPDWDELMDYLGWTR